MSTKSKAIAQMAAALAGDPKVEQEVQHEIITSSFVSHLLSLRVSKGLTQEQIAESMGCDPSKISRIESGNDINLKWPDVVGYVTALGFNMSVLFEDPSIPAAERIKECVWRIHRDLEALTALAEQVGGNDKIAQKIHQFSGEVLLNFLMNHKGHSDKLRSIVRVPTQHLSALEGAACAEIEEGNTEKAPLAS